MCPHTINQIWRKYSNCQNKFLTVLPWPGTVLFLGATLPVPSGPPASRGAIQPHRLHICHLLHKCTFWAQFFSTWKRVNCGKISQNFSKFPKISPHDNFFSTNIICDICDKYELWRKEYCKYQENIFWLKCQHSTHRIDLNTTSTKLIEYTYLVPANIS